MQADLKMEVSRVPEELVWALNLEEGSLHIKGSPGTGKTTLALELAKALAPRESVYVSTRLSLEKIYKFYPWIRETIPSSNIIVAAKKLTPDTPKTSDKQPSEGLAKPDFMEEVYSKIVRGKNKILIVDSIDALKSNTNLPQGDLGLENILLEMGEKTGTSVIMVSETESDCQLDSLVDGVVTLRKRFLEDRILREILVEKMRGAEIKHPLYLFTLAGGRFTYFKNSYHSIPPREIKTQIGGVETDTIPTTIPELDEALNGGLKRSSLNVMELSQGIGLEHIETLTPFYVSGLSRGIPAILVPSRSFSFLDIKTLRKAIMENPALFDNFKKLVHIFQYAKFSIDVSVDKPENVHYLEGRDFRDDIDQIRGVAQELLKNTGKKMFFVGISSDVVSYCYGQQNFFKVLSLWVNQLKLLGAVIGVFYYSQKEQQVLTQFTDVYLKFDKIDGTLILYGKIPKTQIYAITIDYTQKTPTMLTPIQ
ncbi:MAG: AAA family ATPase [Candidatus Freyarchaeota archaeon]|nr:AAA family ATPase [Candidatus Jordarchaeia archaeon]MBS7270079.1 AAA family ATPase [Candidatus Jordarchaeia archaeon]MBS7280741.1 AAA family ATPase [Candidatus Jordarchaeia archaeon]